MSTFILEWNEHHLATVEADTIEEAEEKWDQLNSEDTYQSMDDLEIKKLEE